MAAVLGWGQAGHDGRPSPSRHRIPHYRPARLHRAPHPAHQPTNGPTRHSAPPCSHRSHRSHLFHAYCCPSTRRCTRRRWPLSSFLRAPSRPCQPRHPPAPLSSTAPAHPPSVAPLPTAPLARRCASSIRWRARAAAPARLDCTWSCSLSR